MQFIAEGFKHNLTSTDIADGLSRMVARNIEVEKETATTQAAVQQQSKNDDALQMQTVLKNMSATLEIIADQKAEIAELRKHVADIKERQQEQQEYIDTALKERDQKFIESIRKLQETKKPQKKWWQFRKK